MNKTLYVKDEDGPIWDKARELTGDKLSHFIMDKLRALVSEREEQQQGHERIIMRFYENNLPRAKAFSGRWIIPPGQALICYESDASGRMLEPHYVVAESAKGNFAVVEYHSLPHAVGIGEDNVTIDGYYRFASFYVVATPEEMAQKVSPTLASEVMKRMGIQVQELDI